MTDMRVEHVDERTVTWARAAPAFLVYLFSRDHSAASWTTETMEITGADAAEVMEWAKNQAGSEKLYAVALVTDDRSAPIGQQKGIFWLLGTDANNEGGTEEEQRLISEMLHRRERF